LRKFMECFRKLALSIDNLSLEIALHQMINTLRSGPFVDSLCKRLVTNMVDLRQRATKYMRMEELKDFKSSIKAKDNIPTKNMRKQE